MTDNAYVRLCSTLVRSHSWPMLEQEPQSGAGIVQPHNKGCKFAMLRSRTLVL